MRTCILCCKGRIGRSAAHVRGYKGGIYGLYIEIMEEKMEATIWGLGFSVLGLELRVYGQISCLGIAGFDPGDNMDATNFCEIVSAHRNHVRVMTKV